MLREWNTFADAFSRGCLGARVSHTSRCRPFPLQMFVCRWHWYFWWRHGQWEELWQGRSLNNLLFDWQYQLFPPQNPTTLDLQILDHQMYYIIWLQHFPKPQGIFKTLSSAGFHCSLCWLVHAWQNVRRPPGFLFSQLIGVAFDKLKCSTSRIQTSRFIMTVDNLCLEGTGKSWKQIDHRVFRRSNRRQQLLMVSNMPRMWHNLSVWHFVWSGLQACQDQEVANYSKSKKLSHTQIGHGNTDRPDGCVVTMTENTGRGGGGGTKWSDSLSSQLFIKKTVDGVRKSWLPTLSQVLGW